ncbi:MAG: protein adenylyltransferase Fic [Fusobacteriaceae bacterium]
MILDNKLNITSQIELSEIEEKISKQKVKKFFDSGDINKVQVGTFEGFSYIHNYLFQDIYHFVGKIRNVNISKGGFSFAPLMYLEQSLKYIDKDEYLSSMERSVIKDIETKHLLEQALTSEINDRTLFMKGIDASYYYEGYSEFNIEEL